VLAVAGAEEDLGAREEAVVVLVPVQAAAAAERLEEAVLIREERREDVVRTEHVDRALRVGERDRLLRWQRISAARGVVGDIAARGLVAEPLAHHPRLGPRPLRQLVRRRRTAVGERAVEAEPRAEPDERRTERRRQVDHRVPHERLQPRLVNRRRRHLDTS
jgi:hypothetical protein